MQHPQFINLSELIKETKLGGFEDQHKMIPPERAEELARKQVGKTPRKAAVLALFYPNKEGNTCLALTLRPQYKGTHSAQVSFPGGKHEETDTNLRETALRETYEEVGIPKKDIVILREVTNVYIPPSNFMVTPFIGITKNTPVFKNNHEVEELIEVTLTDILNDKFIGSESKKSFYAENIKVPYFLFNDHIVWGATAMILSEIKELIKRL
jgi:8-oxo-dGTP pyrophosphatase MutT (NUDIX family)